MTLTVETWCEALESGKYQQAKDALRDGDQFCCLGVACDLSGRGEWRGAEYYIDGSGAHAEYLPPEVKFDLGLTSDSGAFEFCSLPAELQEEIRRGYTPVSGTVHLSGLNDAGVPFPIIAKVIRARPEGLFREAA